VQCLWQNLSNKIQTQRHTTCSQHVNHDAAHKTTTKPYTMAKTADTLYRAENMIICVGTDIIKSEITNTVRGTRHEAYV
jgi:thiamine pyrophosphate-dependent acetolactate synthase large subunit-like protein